MAFRYGEPSDRMLRMTRKKFNLDKIAGKGDDISRIKNLLYWVHDNIEHDGSNGLAEQEIWKIHTNLLVETVVVTTAGLLLYA